MLAKTDDKCLKMMEGSVTSLRIRGLGIVKLRGVIVWVGEEFERRGGTLRREIKVFERHKADDTFTPIGGLNPCPTHIHTHTGHLTGYRN